MISIGSSSSASRSLLRLDAAALDPPEEGERVAVEEHGRRIPPIVIPITLSVGLLVAAVYVGIRIFAAKSHAVASVVVQNTTPAPSAPMIPPVASARVETPAPVAAAIPQRQASVHKPEAKAEAVRKADPFPEPVTNDAGDGLIVPQPGERYLQIAAINTRYAPGFLVELSRNNLQARVAPGPREGLVRIVVGPFPDRDSLSRAKTQIQILHPDCFIRVY